METDKKPRVVFAFVEAGLGHIMPMRAIADAFEKKYGERAEVVRTYFYQDKNDPAMRYVEEELVREVKLHNKRKAQGLMQFGLLRLFGTRRSMRYLMEKRYGKGSGASVDYLKELEADLLVNTHFSTLYCACEARDRGEISSKIAAYCPDPVIGLQWDGRADIIALSSKSGKARAAREKRFRNTAIEEIPFLVRKEIAGYGEGKEYYRRELGLPEDNFTVLLADGAYGAGRLRKTVYGLLRSKVKMTVIAVCGRNENLYNELKELTPPPNIHFTPYGFTDKTLLLAAASDLFAGKAGASNLAEPAYFGVPAIVTFRATPIEKWISAHYVKHIGSAILEENVKKAVRLIESFAKDPRLMLQYIQACQSQRRSDGPELLADLLWERLVNG